MSVFEEYIKKSFVGTIFSFIDLLRVIKCCGTKGGCQVSIKSRDK